MFAISQLSRCAEKFCSCFALHAKGCGAAFSHAVSCKRFLLSKHFCFFKRMRSFCTVIVRASAVSVSERLHCPFQQGMSLLSIVSTTSLVEATAESLVQRCADTQRKQEIALDTHKYTYAHPFSFLCHLCCLWSLSAYTAPLVYPPLLSPFSLFTRHWSPSAIALQLSFENVGAHIQIFSPRTHSEALSLEPGRAGVLTAFLCTLRRILTDTYFVPFFKQAIAAGIEILKQKKSVLVLCGAIAMLSSMIGDLYVHNDHLCM